MKKLLSIALAAVIFSCNTTTDSTSDVQQFLDNYTNEWLGLYKISAEAEWASNTRIVEGDTSNAWNVTQANEAYAKFSGSQ